MELINKKIQKLEEERVNLEERGKEYLTRIKSGARFGYPDSFDYYGEGSFHPCELLEVVNEDEFIIKIKEISTGEICERDVFGLVVVKEDFIHCK
jgi:hypothetical protein